VGANVFACLSTNTWTVQGDAGGTLTIKSEGVTVGVKPTLNIVPGIGIGNAITDAGSEIIFQQFADTALLLTQGTAQSGVVQKCGSASGSGSAYTCLLTPTLNTFTAGMVLHWIPDVNGNGGTTTLNIDTLGPKAVKLADGISNPIAADIAAGKLYLLWYDGANFRMAEKHALPGVAEETQPSCGPALRGRFWYLAGGTGFADGLQVCAKDGSEGYVWVTLF
jgi:hypothetical protein